MMDNFIEDKKENEKGFDSYITFRLNFRFLKWTAAIILVIFIFNVFFSVKITLRPNFNKFVGRADVLKNKEIIKNEIKKDLGLENAVLPAEGVIILKKWGDLGKKLVKTGAIDRQKFEELYANRGGLDEDKKSLLYGGGNGAIKIDAENANFILNLLWAFGLANKNDILEKGPMQDPQYGGAGGFSSTGGWTLAYGEAMSHYSKHALVVLDKKQQSLVEEVSKNIYRPCCGNSTYFPDCNHGMAMLGLLELLASEGKTAEEMYKIALAVNSYWFPGTYLTLAKYFEKQGKDWSVVDPKLALSANYSSASGYRQVLAQIEPVQSSGGGSCGA